MSLRRFNPFASNASVNNRRSSTRSARPPTYTSDTGVAPAYTPSVNYSGVTTWSGSLPSASSIAFPDSDSVFDQAGSSADITKPAGPRYSELGCYPHPKLLDDKLLSVYYRVYAEDGAIPSTNHVYSDDPYLGRILAELVAPPHVVISLKRCLLSVENIDNTTIASLFIASSSRTPMDDGGRVSILAYPGPGCTPNEPMALVVKLSGSYKRPVDVKSPEAVLLPSQEGPTPFETRYSTRYKESSKSLILLTSAPVYYRIYKQQGAVLSKQPADPNRPSVGRINVDSIPPPHTAESMMRCISKIEELDNSKQSQLFIDISSEFPIGDRHVSILSSDRPGSSPDNPMAFVVEPVLAGPSPAPVVVPTPYPTFKKLIRVTRGQGESKCRLLTLSCSPGFQSPIAGIPVG